MLTRAETALSLTVRKQNLGFTNLQELLLTRNGVVYDGKRVDEPRPRLLFGMYSAKQKMLRNECGAASRTRAFGQTAFLKYTPV